MEKVDWFVGGISAFLLGIVAASLGWNIYLLITTEFFLGVGFLLYKKKLVDWGKLAALIILTMAGSFYYHVYLNFKASRTVPLNQKTSLIGVIVDEPRAYEKYETLTVDLREPWNGEIEIVKGLYGEIKYGDLIKVQGVILPPASEKDIPVSFFPKIEKLGEHHGFWLKEKLLDFKNLLIGQFKRNLPYEEAELLSGITFGARGSFSEQLKNNMAASGTTHLVALSGYNITILVLGVSLLFGYFLSRRLTFYLTVAVICLFVIMTGAQASVIRAAVMGFLALLANQIGRLFTVRTVIAFTALVMTIFNPTVLIFDIGFLLSFMSLLGLIYLAPAISRFFKIENAGFLSWRVNAATTLSAQLMVMPIIIINFNNFSAVAPLANILILEFIPLTMFFGFILSIAGLVYSQLAFIFAKIVHVFLAYELGVINFFARFSVPLPLKIFGSWAFLILYYLAIILFIRYFRVEKAKI